MKSWIDNNQERMVELKANWFQENKDKVNEKYKERYQNDPLFRAHRINKLTTLNAFFTTGTKPRFVDCLGCTTHLFVSWINFCLKRSGKDFTCQNHGDTWHFVHVIPINMFDTGKNEEAKICYNWRNVMPYGRMDNLTKNKYIDFEQLQIHYNNLVEFHKSNSMVFPKEYDELYAKHLKMAGNPLQKAII
jgi:hypothetical protein